ncbi:hypothetical protein QU487_06395 [Crenobacter sp. SG2305]|uniref:hypothetical protein n=1 Tax=Crenobacter oryzisoli TaxID=3056844 RepID=UPI0025AB1C0F|nr:hypothetical protein [Crenobacter sp. SG2305]MDN0082382.1 hypothetical protein [Crenobacter sp. SG2305]
MAHTPTNANNSAMLSGLPLAVQTHVQFHLGRLREHERALDRVIACRGKGYNLALELRDRQCDIKKTQAVLASFRELAGRNGIDGGAVIATLGGEPSFSQFGEPASGN